LTALIKRFQRFGTFATMPQQPATFGKLTKAGLALKSKAKTCMLCDSKLKADDGIYASTSEKDVDFRSLRMCSACVEKHQISECILDVKVWYSVERLIRPSHCMLTASED
jgi:hypothetical protein